LEKLKLKKELGFDLGKMRIPKRIFEVETFKGNLDSNYIERALNYYEKKYYRAV
jgi:hypothetical protein